LPMKRYGAFIATAGTDESFFITRLAIWSKVFQQWLFFEWNRERETPKSTFHAVKSWFLCPFSLYVTMGRTYPKVLRPGCRNTLKKAMLSVTFVQRQST
jgi:hypothetical protein